MPEKVKTWGIPIAGLLCMAISSYVAVRTANGSVVVEVLCSLLTAVSIALMAWAVVGAVKSQRNSHVLTTALDKAKQTIAIHEHAACELKISNAFWGTDTGKNCVTDVLNSKPRNALMLYINQDAFPLPDPAYGNDDKYLEVTYCYGGRDPSTVRRTQRQYMILPEDPWLMSENQRLTQAVTKLKAEVGTLRGQLPTKDNLSDVDHGIYS